jgi:hypothetical protein
MHLPTPPVPACRGASPNPISLPNPLPGQWQSRRRTLPLVSPPLLIAFPSRTVCRLMSPCPLLF